MKLTSPAPVAGRMANRKRRSAPSATMGIHRFLPFTCSLPPPVCPFNEEFRAPVKEKTRPKASRDGYRYGYADCVFSIASHPVAGFDAILAHVSHLFRCDCASRRLTPAPRVDIITQSCENGGLSGGHRNWKAILLRQVRRRVRRHARFRAGKYPLLRRADEQEVSDRDGNPRNPRFRGRRRRSAAPPFPVRRQRQKGEHANAQPTRTTLPMRDVRDDGPLHEARPGRDSLLRGGDAGAAAAKAALVRLERRTGGGRPRNIASATVAPPFPRVSAPSSRGLPPRHSRGFLPRLPSGLPPRHSRGFLPRHSRESGNPETCATGSAGVPPANALARVTLIILALSHEGLTGVDLRPISPTPEPR